MSYFNTTSSAEPFVFVSGEWVLKYNAPIHCGGPTGPRVRVDRTATMDLPSPATDPINVLTGTGHDVATDSRCIINSDMNLRFERIGD